MSENKDTLRNKLKEKLKNKKLLRLNKEKKDELINNNLNNLNNLNINDTEKFKKDLQNIKNMKNIDINKVNQVVEQLKNQGFDINSILNSLQNK
jgi:hypothetical protein